jgi:hypothetical protein
MKVLTPANQPDRAAMRDPATARRVHDALRLVKALGISYTVAYSSIGNTPTPAAASDLYAALRSQHSASEWSTLIKPINDSLRVRRRDALVAYALVGLSNDADPVRAAIDTPDRLYEYLLLDVLVHPRVETSRIRQAIAAVQQFIQRLVDLPGTEAADIHVPLAMREQWPWMKRYRVWEANRKVFLYPENWLEPELRDDQSPIFRETMSELLQGDITEERAAEAMIGYLRKLEELSMLEPSGIHVDNRETATDVTDDVAHVVARSSGANRKYFYRRREPSGWTPWEAVKLDVEDNPVLPVRWKGRLFLFWLKVIQEAGPAEKPNWTSGNLVDQTAASAKPNDPTHRVKAMLCWSEYVKGKWGSTRTSSSERAVTIGIDFTSAAGGRPFRREDYRLRAEVSNDALDLWISEAPKGGLDLLQRTCGYRLYNGFAEPDPLPHRSENGLITFPGIFHYGMWPARTAWTDDRSPDPSAESALRVSYRVGSQSIFEPPEAHALFRRRDGFGGSAIAPCYQVLETWNRTAPFFYCDAKFAFYITPVSVAQVNLGPWKWIESGTTGMYNQGRSVKALKNAEYMVEGSRVLLDDGSAFAFGAHYIDKFGLVEKT